MTKEPTWLYTLIILLAIVTVLVLLMAGAMLTLHISLSAILEALEWSSLPAARTTIHNGQYYIDPEVLAHGEPIR